jgi:aryl-alcohol dehydrogenase-like predicted oxidoreductase
MNFGWHTSQEESFKIMDRALELGINFFDTADIYGWGGEQGDTEEILGRWFAQGGGRSLSAYKIRKHCEGSLKRLQTDHIDLYQMHHVDRDCPWDETWQAFEQLGHQGNWSPPCVPRKLRWTEKSWKASTRFSQVLAAKPQRPTPGRL